MFCSAISNEQIECWNIFYSEFFIFSLYFSYNVFPVMKSVHFNSLSNAVLILPFYQLKEYFIHSLIYWDSHDITIKLPWNYLNLKILGLLMCSKTCLLIISNINVIKMKESIRKMSGLMDN